MDAFDSDVVALLLFMVIKLVIVIPPLIAIVSLEYRTPGVLERLRARFCFKRRDGHELADDDTTITMTHGRKEVK